MLAISSRWLLRLGLTLAFLAAAPATGDSLPAGFWTAEQADEILDQTLVLHLDTDLEDLNDIERRAVWDLLQTGEIMHRLYLDARHHQSLQALSEIQGLHLDRGRDTWTSKLLDLFEIFKGPIATTLDNERLPFLPVDDEVPGKNVYPRDLSRQELLDYVAAHPEERDELLAGRTVVRRASEDNLRRALTSLQQHPALAQLHPGLEKALQTRLQSASAQELFALPYSLVWADDISLAFRFLSHAADTVRPIDRDFAAYLGNRARDLLADDYEAGDASWVTGSFGRLNAQIGSYETYDDELQGVKSFFSLSLLLRDEERSQALAAAMRNLQAIEDALPYDGERKVRGDTPVGVYNVIADFGQARGTNTATILPNESDHARKYGRTIILRYNILTHPELFADAKRLWDAVVSKRHSDDLSLQGRFDRTLWHEVGHYLGPIGTTAGDSLDAALGEHSDLIEELKSDLIALQAAPGLLAAGHYDDASLKAVYADGIRRTLQRVRPRRNQPYQTMQLMQMNYFLQTGLLRFDEASGRLDIDYPRYPETVAAMLQEVLKLQSTGDRAAATDFIETWATWSEELHGALAEKMRQASRYRYRLVRYGVLE